MGLGLGGALLLLIKTDYEYLPNEFNEMPEATTEEIKAKIVKGEVYLSSLSTKAKNARYIGAGFSAATGVAAIAYYLSLPVSPYDSYYRDTYLYEGITLLGSAAISLLIKSRAEKEYETYITWKKSQGIVKQDSTGKHRFFTPELVPLCGGIGISFSYN